LIGNIHDRFAISRAYASDLDDALKISLLPKLNMNDKVLEVGDGPGVVCEMITSDAPDLKNLLHIQATDLEGAVYQPLVPRSSDLSRAMELQESFQCIIALQVFNNLTISDLEPQLKLAHRLIQPDGWLLLVKAALLEVRHPSDAGDALLIFEELESLVEEIWPNTIKGRTLVETTFDDADLEPLMMWNQDFTRIVRERKLSVPESIGQEEKVLLDELLSQIRLGTFDPDQIHFEWLALKAREAGFHLEEIHENPESKFYFHLYKRLN